MFSTKIVEAVITEVTIGYHHIRHDEIVGERITETRDGYDQLLSRSSRLVTKSRTDKIEIDVAHVAIDGMPFDSFRMRRSPAPGEAVYVFEHRLAGRKSVDLFHRRTASIIFHGTNPYAVGSRKPYLIFAALIFVAAYLYAQRPGVAIASGIAGFAGGLTLAYLRYFAAKIILGTMRINARRRVLYGG
jgi:hypothetical protein